MSQQVEICIPLKCFYDQHMLLSYQDLNPFTSPKAKPVAGGAYMQTGHAQISQPLLIMSHTHEVNLPPSYT